MSPPCRRICECTHRGTRPGVFCGAGSCVSSVSDSGQVLSGAMRIRTLVASAVAKSDEQRTNVFLTATSNGDTDTVLQASCSRRQYQQPPLPPPHKCLLSLVAVLVDQSMRHAPSLNEMGCAGAADVTARVRGRVVRLRRAHRPDACRCSRPRLRHSSPAGGPCSASRRASGPIMLSCLGECCTIYRGRLLGASIAR